MSTPDNETNRRYPRLRCFAAVSLRAKDPDLFLMGDLSSVGRGGCCVETENRRARPHSPQWCFYRFAVSFSNSGYDDTGTMLRSGG